MNPAPSPAGLPGSLPPVFGCSLAVLVRADSKGQVLTQESVLDSDLADARAEAWRECFLRRGWTGVPLADARFQLIPILRPNSDSTCAGFALEVEAPDGTLARHEFGTRALADVAHRAANRLTDLNILEPGHPFVYEVAVDRVPRDVVHAIEASVACRASIRTLPLRTLSVPLQLLLAKARAENVVDGSHYPVFITEEALRAAEHYSRKGAAASPPVETGAALAGVLCSSPCGEFFSVVTEALEAVAPENSEFSLEFSSTSWRRIQRVIEARQSVQPGYRMIASSHGHNYMPNGGKTCEACATRPFCDLTNLFISGDDRTWSQAVFSQQPWGLCLIYGLSARGDKLRGLWGLEDGRLRERGFFVLPEFDPARWELKQ